MFERFTQEARKVAVEAQQAARSLNHGFICPGHLFLGVFMIEDTIANPVLTNAGYSFEDAKEALIKVLPSVSTPSSNRIPFSPEAKKILEYSMRGALHMGHSYIGPEHILLALLEWGDATVTPIVAELKIYPDALREAVLTSITENDPENIALTVEIPQELRKEVLESFTKLKEFMQIPDDQPLPFLNRLYSKLRNSATLTVRMSELDEAIHFFMNNRHIICPAGDHPLYLFANELLVARSV